MSDRKEYMRELMAKKRAANKPANNVLTNVSEVANKLNENVSNPVSTATNIKTYPDKEHLFDGKGRGVVVNGYVLIAGVGVIDELTWKAKLNQTCIHGFKGWACKLH